ncbi:MAG TPA: hypothetical protein VMD53_01440 [Rhizomicrobium sp.]|nr:hypothetical protein [Rhizomicrobium sp.]
MTPAPIKPSISKDLLDQIDIRVGTIEAVSDVPGSDKLLALRVNFGDHSRTILSGMKKERADPQEIAGRQALFVVNLAPRKMAGVVSEGMLFDAMRTAFCPPWPRPNALSPTAAGRDKPTHCQPTPKLISFRAIRNRSGWNRQ